jgi:hypothetical protein
MIKTAKNRIVAAKAMMVGVLRGKTETMATIIHTAEIAIQDTAEVGGDLGDVATGLVQGAIHGAKELGVSVEEAAAFAADGALKAAHQVSSAAFDIVRNAVTQTIYGVKVVMRGPDIIVSPLLPETSFLDGRKRASSLKPMDPIPLAVTPLDPPEALATATMEGEGGLTS